MLDSIHWLVFASGLLSSTLLPGNSEAVFSLAILDSPELTITLLIAVTAGNTLGGLISWGMGRIIAIRYPAAELTKPGNSRALASIHKWGSPVLLFSWVPVIGDPLCVAAGWLKISPVSSAIYIATGKLLRYALLAWLIM